MDSVGKYDDALSSTDASELRDRPRQRSVEIRLVAKWRRHFHLDIEVFRVTRGGPIKNRTRRTAERRYGNSILGPQSAKKTVQRPQ
jgi:hypothetical protein